MDKRRFADRIFWLAILISLLVMGFLLYKQYRGRNQIVVYELTWQAEDKDGQVVENRWRYYIQYRTKLPVRIDKFVKTSEAGEYRLTERLLIDYPVDKP